MWTFAHWVLMNQGFAPVQFIHVCMHGWNVIYFQAICDICEHLSRRNDADDIHSIYDCISTDTSQIQIFVPYSKK